MLSALESAKGKGQMKQVSFFNPNQLSKSQMYSVQDLRFGPTVLELTSQILALIS